MGEVKKDSKVNFSVYAETLLFVVEEGEFPSMYQHTSKQTNEKKVVDWGIVMIKILRN